MSAERRDIPYLAFRFFQDFALIYPVYVIMFERIGLGFMQIAWLLVIWAIAVLVTEIPSGVLADLWSRRGVLFVALLLKATGFVVWLLYPSFGGFAAGFVLWGIQEGLTAGVTEALLFDSLQRRGRERYFEAIAGLGTLVARIAIAAAMVLGGALFAANPGLVLVCSSAAMVISALCTLGMTGGAAPQRDGRHAAGKLSETLHGIADAARAAFATPGMPALVLAGAFSGVLYGVLDEYDTLFATLHGVPLAWVGIWGALRFSFEGVGGVLAPRLSRLLGDDNPPRFGLWLAAAGVGLLAGTLTGRHALLPLYFVFFGMMAAAEVVFQGYVQRRVTSSGRATVGSLVSFVSEVLGIGVLLLYGVVARAFGLRAIFWLGGVLTVITGGAYTLWAVLRRRGNANW